MSDANGRKAKRRVFQPETLEGRLLLNATRATPAITGVLRSLGRTFAPPVSGLQGRISGTRASDGLYGGTPAGYDSYSGHGRSPVGDLVFGASFLKTPGATISDPSFLDDGSAVFRVGHKGEQIQVNFFGDSTSRIPGRTSWMLAGAVVGGTGRFEGAGGLFSGNLTTFGGPAGVNGSFSLNYSIRLDQPV